MARTITVAALQTSYGEDMAANIKKTEGLIREAAEKEKRAREVREMMARRAAEEAAAKVSRE